MASDILGKQMDIHSGGVDLMFPHHDNEMAQSEVRTSVGAGMNFVFACHVRSSHPLGDFFHFCSQAFYDNDQWVNYFVHSGHLHIEGLKMSKSLKNFITIKQALEKYTARQIRFMFLMHDWRSTLDYSDHSMSEAIDTEKTFNEFFLSVKAELQRVCLAPEAFRKVEAAERQLVDSLFACKAAVHTCLCNNIDTVR